MPLKTGLARIAGFGVARRQDGLDPFVALFFRLSPQIPAQRNARGGWREIKLKKRISYKCCRNANYILSYFSANILRLISNKQVSDDSPNWVVDGNVEATLVKLVRPNVDAWQADCASATVSGLVFADNGEKERHGIITVTMNIRTVVFHQFTTPCTKNTSCNNWESHREGQCIGLAIRANSSSTWTNSPRDNHTNK